MHSVLSYCKPMDVCEPTQNVAVLGDHLKRVAPKGKGKGKGNKRGSYKANPWHNWSLPEKQEVCNSCVPA